MLTLLPFLAAHAAPYELDFGVAGVNVGSAEWNLHQDLLDQLNSGVVDVELTQYDGDESLSWAQNGVSQLTFSTSSAVHGDAPARALRWSVNGVWECDMAVNANVTWTTTDAVADSNQYGGAGRTLGTTLMHELGHCLRIGHKATEYNIMGIDFTHVGANGGSLYFYLGEDAADRLVAIHDPVTTFEDVGVVHWRYAGNPDGDEYSNHERTVVLSAGSQLLPRFFEDSNDTPVYLVRQGANVRPEFTFENNGSTNNVDVEVSYRLSTNDLITSSDPWIGSTAFSMGRDTVYTSSREVWIPSWTTPGRYHLGARIDDLVGLTDDVAQNNATWVDVEVIANGDVDYCLGPEPCERFQGDCDADAECAGSLQCIEDVGAQYGFTATTDVCDYPLGHEWYCSPEEPCDLGEGDCDTNADCAVGYCAQNVGAQYGLPATVDVCQVIVIGL